MNCNSVRVIKGLSQPVRYNSREFEITLKKIREALDRAWESLGSLGVCGTESALERKKSAIAAWRVVVVAFDKNSIVTGARVAQSCKSHPMAMFSILCLMALMQGFRSSLFISFP
jgi:hypothetical protein